METKQGPLRPGPPLHAIAPQLDFLKPRLPQYGLRVQLTLVESRHHGTPPKILVLASLVLGDLMCYMRYRGLEEF
jgi:hypothetical protein